MTTDKWQMENGLAPIVGFFHLSPATAVCPPALPSAADLLPKGLPLVILQAFPMRPVITFPK
jgi:hypothetical protein